MYVPNQATTYPPRLLISKANNIKVVVDKVCPRLPILDATKRKGFKLYFYEEIPTRQMKVDMVNYSKNWSSIFSGKKLVQALDAYDTKTFWNQIVWHDTLKSSSSGYDGSANDNHQDFIQVLHLAKTYHFDNACVYYTKDANNYSIINCLRNLPTIFHETTYDLSMMDEQDFLDHVTKLCDAQKEEEQVFIHASREQVAKAFAKIVDNNFVNEFIIDLTNTSVMEETPSL